MKADLRDVTICAVDSVNVSLAARAIDRSVEQCDVADAILFSHRRCDGRFRWIETEPIDSLAGYSRFVLKRLPSFVDTPFVLIVQWDGYVVDAAAWRPEFRDYDYIGARWPWIDDGMAVGNGGFSLRSRKLLSAVLDPRFEVPPDTASDLLVCRTWRRQLEQQFGVRYGTDAIADLFSYESLSVAELVRPRAPTFGFHGAGNIWRHADDASLAAMVGELAPYVFATPHYARLVLASFLLGKFALLAVLYDGLKTHVDPDMLRGNLNDAAGGKPLGEECIAAGEGLTRHRALRGLTIQSMRARRAWSESRLRRALRRAR